MPAPHSVRPRPDNSVAPLASADSAGGAAAAIAGFRLSLIWDDNGQMSNNGEAHDTTYKLPVGYFVENRMIRSIIVTHDCMPFQVNATLANSHRALIVDLITCGD
jgi:hypothetical protein